MLYVRSANAPGARCGIRTLLLLGMIVLFLPFAAAHGQTSSPSGTSAGKPSSKAVHHKSKHRRRSRRGAWKRKGQQKIDAARVKEIQAALIREKYLDGEPSGQWDARTQDAMTRYQSDNGWQSKVTPDSRALIKLGLGPNHDQDLINEDKKPTGAAATPNSAGKNGDKQ